jgi:hypothetical protein
MELLFDISRFILIRSYATFTFLLLTQAFTARLPLPMVTEEFTDETILSTAGARRKRFNANITVVDFVRSNH